MHVVLSTPADSRHGMVIILLRRVVVENPTLLSHVVSFADGPPAAGCLLHAGPIPPKAERARRSFQEEACRQKTQTCLRSLTGLHTVSTHMYACVAVGTWLRSRLAQVTHKALARLKQSFSFNSADGFLRCGLVNKSGQIVLA